MVEFVGLELESFPVDLSPYRRLAGTLCVELSLNLETTSVSCSFSPQPAIKWVVKGVGVRGRSGESGGI